jgi:nucleotide-binding universal stress UspA family protein
MATKKSKESKYDSVILIPTDFSEVCGNAVIHGVHLARFLRYKAVILHVINNETKAALKKKNVGTDYVERRLKEYKTYYEKKYDIQVETIAEEGSIFTTISEVASRIKANLMILGTHGKRGLQHVFGSYAMRVVSESPCPVIVVQKRSFKQGYESIVLPVSNDLEARQTVEWAKLMGHLFKSKIHIFQAVEQEKGLNSRLKIISGQITDALKHEKIRYEITHAEMKVDYSKQLLAFATRERADMIMIMTRPNVDIPGFSIAGWAEKLMFNESQIPVMCINPVDLGYYYYEWIQLA